MHGIDNLCPWRVGILSTTFASGKPGTYVLHSSCAGNGAQPKFAVALSNHAVKVYNANGTLLDEYVHEGNITRIKYSKKQPALLFSSSTDGKLRLWDERCQGPVQTYFDDSDGKLKPITCFDLNYDEDLLCAGTELIREDSFLLFWDPRTSKSLGGYWNSHTDDFTQVNFHPATNSCMASSSLDGLINIYDLNQTTEDDAVMYTLNIEQAVNTFCWMYKVTGSEETESIACLTSLEEYQVWHLEEASPHVRLTKENISNKSTKTDYMIDSVQIDRKWFLASGNNDGSVRLYGTDLPLKLELWQGYLLKGHSDTVRTLCYSSETDVILTGGEDGLVCLSKVPRCD